MDYSGQRPAAPAGGRPRSWRGHHHRRLRPHPPAGARAGEREGGRQVPARGDPLAAGPGPREAHASDGTRLPSKADRGEPVIEPYQALGLVPTMRGIRRREEISVNIEHLAHLIKAASWLSSLDLPVRLIAVPEGALQGFNDEVLDLDHEEF